MSVLSIRFKRAGCLDRLKQAAAAQGQSVSGLGERLIDEGLRMDAHPGIVFRPGPSGRRAGLAHGPDVSEVISLLLGLPGTLEERIAETAQRMSLNVLQVRTAAGYYAEFTAEIDARIAANIEYADRELAKWEAQRRLLSG